MQTGHKQAAVLLIPSQLHLATCGSRCVTAMFLPVLFFHLVFQKMNKLGEYGEKGTIYCRNST